MSKKVNRKILWLTWEKQVRNRSLSRELGVPLFEILSKRSRIIRYATCISRTLVLLYREKPGVVICQNPSLVLTLLLLWLRPLFGIKIGIDAHFAGIHSTNGSDTYQRVLDYCNRTADFVIVTNKNHADRVRNLGGRAFVCADPLPDLTKHRDLGTEVPLKVFFICSFDIDEPYREVFHAAKILAPEGFRFFVSGNYRKQGITPEDFPHVDLLGFVSESDFYGHLFSSQVVVDLTENDNCLVCGAYEALEAGKPLVLSKKMALEEYFTGGTVFTENQGTNIAEAVRVAYSERLRLVEESGQWVIHAREDIREKVISIKTYLEKA